MSSAGLVSTTATASTANCQSAEFLALDGSAVSDGLILPLSSLPSAIQRSASGVLSLRFDAVNDIRDDESEDFGEDPIGFSPRNGLVRVVTTSPLSLAPTDDHFLPEPTSGPTSLTSPSNGAAANATLRGIGGGLFSSTPNTTPSHRSAMATMPRYYHHVVPGCPTADGPPYHHRIDPAGAITTTYVDNDGDDDGADSDSLGYALLPKTSNDTQQDRVILDALSPPLHAMGILDIEESNSHITPRSGSLQAPTHAPPLTLS